jgi:ABC-type uncharacterized transport system substrate-binding protein
MKRREFITLIGGAAAFPLAAQAQQAPVPIIGLLDARSPDGFTDRLRGFRQGLRETGYTEGENVAIEYRWAQNQNERLTELAVELVRRRAAVLIASGGSQSASAAKAATSTIPILFLTGEDPVKLGLVTSLARPNGNLTGINLFNDELVAKRMELLRELVPRATRVAVLVSPLDVTNTEATRRAMEVAARGIGLQVQIFTASTSREIDAAFETMARERQDAVFVGQSPFLNLRRVQLVQLAARHAIPAAYGGREYTEVGGLMSYGSDISEAYRQIGIYAGRILKGAKPMDLPVVQASKFELIINHQTARMIGLAVPQTLLTAADEVIE